MGTGETLISAVARRLLLLQRLVNGKLVVWRADEALGSVIWTSFEIPSPATNRRKSTLPERVPGDCSKGVCDEGKNASQGGQVERESQRDGWRSRFARIGVTDGKVCRRPQTVVQVSA